MVIILLFALCFFNHYCITPTGTFCILRFKRCKYFILIKCVRRVLPGTLFKDNRFAILRCDFSAIAAIYYNCRDFICSIIAKLHIYPVTKIYYFAFFSKNYSLLFFVLLNMQK